MGMERVKRNMQTFIHGKKHEEILLERYTLLERLQEAIHLGDERETRRIIVKIMCSIDDADHLYTTREENLKQIYYQLISMNTAFSINAFSAGAPVLAIHSLSRGFEQRIGRIRTRKEALMLAQEIAKDYCGLIREVSAEHYGSFSDKVIQLLQTHLSEPLSLEELSEHMNVTPATLCRKFKMETGITVNTYLNQSRIRLAQIYMKEGEKNLTEIALGLGFNDVSYFSKVFQKVTGERPSVYIKRITQEG